MNYSLTRFLAACSLTTLALTSTSAALADHHSENTQGMTTPAAAAPLIPREDLFGNPTRASGQISPDGKWLSWRAPKDGSAGWRRSTA